MRRGCESSSADAARFGRAARARAGRGSSACPGNKASADFGTAKLRDGTDRAAVGAVHSRGVAETCRRIVPEGRHREATSADDGPRPIDPPRVQGADFTLAIWNQPDLGGAAW